MKKTLLITASLLAATLSGNAENQIYIFDEEIDGTMYAVSANGSYAVGGDEDNSCGIYWEALSPADIMIVEDCVFYGVANDGTAVGSMYVNGSSADHAGYYSLSERKWYRLPESDRLLSRSYARAISPDGKYIGGYQFIKDPTSEISGRNYPCLWTRNEYGEYELTMYDEIALPPHQGFCTLSMTDDGKVLAGTVYCAFAANIPALIVDGEMVIFNELSEKSVTETFEYQGNEYTTDYTYYFIDGYGDNDSLNTFHGNLISVDRNNNFYGFRTRAVNVQEDGTGELLNGACIYNPDTNEWVDNTSYGYYYTGLNGNYISANGGQILVDGKGYDLLQYFGLECEREVSGLSAYSADGSVSAGATIYLNEAVGIYGTQPFVVVLDEPLVAGVESVNDESDNASVLVNGNQIVVLGAENVAVYNTNGSLVSNKAVTTADAGIYIVKADNAVKKVVVK
jgi:hypothetical protein